MGPVGGRQFVEVLEGLHRHHGRLHHGHGLWFGEFEFPEMELQVRLFGVMPVRTRVLLQQVDPAYGKPVIVKRPSLSRSVVLAWPWLPLVPRSCTGRARRARRAAR